jgi:hypothetical protein
MVQIFEDQKPAGCDDFMDLVVLQQKTLDKEVLKYCTERKV